ncbi:laminin G domain-containing protein [Asanoa sp. WMMD1127]|uniref:laminin G domain-containing protein n=1 Tax=Asanoa sp. WMMD1127 TaxID=3016107 RepID=UPI002418055A|nr:laminin G domain-containing protein [Asanoa sp. WMMD1127]MDG4826989.1 laminin G domain-containing protein [Asanoa sp. WMMD1127]
MTGVPPLDDVAGEWVAAGDLGHLPSLRNQRGQAHVNHDLTSVSWLAAPPFAGGYHTGVLRVDGGVPGVQHYRWKPWGTRRSYRDAHVDVVTDTSLGYDADWLLWRIQVTNTRAEAATVELTQDLFAPVGHSETGWGWLHTVPWNASGEHDYHALERIRDTTRPGAQGAPYLLGPGPRRLRLGRPRPPGIQRDEDSAPMLLEYELPRHVSADWVWPHTTSVRGAVRALTAGTGLAFPGPVVLDDGAEVPLDAFELTPGVALELEFRADDPGHDGVLLTHGNHPDSLQLGIAGGRLWLAICGERETADRPLEAGRWHHIRVEVDAHRAALVLDGAEVARTGHWTRAVRWRSTVDDGTVAVIDTASAARAAYAFAVPPDELVPHGAGARATWRLDLAPGATDTVGFALAWGTGSVAGEARAAAATLDAELAATADAWRRLWAHAFTPGNPDFSGHLPTLRTPDEDLARAYHMGALLAVYLRNTRVGRTGPVFLTGGPRLGATTTFFWDHTEWSRLYAMLDPSGLRAWLLAGLASPYDTAFGYDVRGGGPLGNYYVSNEYALFRLVEHYVGSTGDIAFLSEPAGGRTVLDHLERLAYGVAGRRGDLDGLADFGADAWRVLECVPNYVDGMASFNAAYVGMLRSWAELLRYLGRDSDADRADGVAATLADAVLGLYAGGGRWQIAHPGGRETIGHVLDFGLVAAAMAGDLTREQRAEMVAFVVDKLLAGPWMRALAADDPIAPFSDRPDHGAGGAFGAWPGVTAYGLARLGRPDLAAGVLGRTPRAASGGLWGQAMEIVPGAGELRVRVAGRGVANRDSIAGAATAEAVVAGLFGVEPDFAALRSTTPRPATVTVAGLGTLENLNLRPVPAPVETVAPPH